MSREEQERWEQLYETRQYPPRTEPSPLLVTWLPSLHRGRALDIACGLGRNAIFLAEHGYEVHAIDISANALAQAQDWAARRGLTIHWIQADLDDYALPPAAYDVIANSFYLNRGLVPQVCRALRPGGYLLFEHHFLTSEAVDGPTDPNFRLCPGELLQLFAPLRIAWHREAIVQEEGRKTALAQLVAYKASGEIQADAGGAHFLEHGIAPSRRAVSV